jgi:hypothetical protein
VYLCSVIQHICHRRLIFQFTRVRDTDEMVKVLYIDELDPSLSPALKLSMVRASLIAADRRLFLDVLIYRNSFQEASCKCLRFSHTKTLMP